MGKEERMGEEKGAVRAAPGKEAVAGERWRRRAGGEHDMEGELGSGSGRKGRGMRKKKGKRKR